MKKGNSTHESVDKECDITEFQAFFVQRIAKLVRLEIEAIKAKNKLSDELLTKLKENGFGDKHISHLTGIKQNIIRNKRKKLGIVSSFLMVDT